MAMVALGEAFAQRVAGLDPQKFPQETFELWSIPSFDSGAPDIVVGSKIGSAKKCVVPGDVLLSKIVPHIRRSWVVRPQEKFRQIASGEWIVFRDSRFSPDFMRHYLISDLFHKKFMATVAGVGGSLLRAQPREVAKIKIPLPPLDEQRRIVGLLDRAAEIRRRADAARAKARAIIPALFLNTFGDPAINSGRWPELSISQAGEVKLGRQRAPKYQSGAFTRPYVRVANIHEDRVDIGDILSMDFDTRDFSTYRLEYGDVLLNEGQSTELVGRPAMWRNEIPDCCFQNTLVRFRANRKKIEPTYALQIFLWMYRNGQLSQISSKTSNVAHLGAARFARLSIILPPLPLQTAFAEQVHRLESLARHLDAAAAKAAAMAASLSAEVFG